MAVVGFGMSSADERGVSVLFFFSLDKSSRKMSRGLMNYVSIKEKVPLVTLGVDVFSCATVSSFAYSAGSSDTNK